MQPFIAVFIKSKIELNVPLNMQIHARKVVNPDKRLLTCHSFELA